MSVSWLTQTTLQSFWPKFYSLLHKRIAPFITTPHFSSSPLIKTLTPHIPQGKHSISRLHPKPHMTHEILIIFTLWDCLASEFSSKKFAKRVSKKDGRKAVGNISWETGAENIFSHLTDRKTVEALHDGFHMKKKIFNVFNTRPSKKQLFTLTGIIEVFGAD